MSDVSDNSTAHGTGGAAAGATVGWAAGGPIGAGIGAIIGAIVGGFGGASIGRSKKKAKRALRQAQAIQKQREINAEKAQYLRMIREARVARAQSASASFAYGAEKDSLPILAASSIGSQLGYSMETLAEDRRLFELYSQYMAAAGKAADSAANKDAFLTGTTNLVFTAGLMGIASQSGSKGDLKPLSAGGK